MVYFIGAGPGDPELRQSREKKRSLTGRMWIIYAGSLVNPQVLADRKPEAVVYDSAGMHLDQVIAVMEQAEKRAFTTARYTGRSGDLRRPPGVDGPAGGAGHSL